MEALVSVPSSDFPLTERNVLMSKGGEGGFMFLLENGNLTFQAGSANHSAALPTAGMHAFHADLWFHTAVTYDGVAGSTGNLKLYWTRLDSGAVSANEIGACDMQTDLVDPNQTYALESLPLDDIGGSACTGTNRCGKCEGDCDGNSQCAIGLLCRNPTSGIRGCGPKTANNWEYCYDPTLNYG